MASPNQVERWQDPAYLDPLAKPHYKPLPYHNFPHGVYTADIALGKAEAAISHGVNIVAEVFPADGRLHDAGFYLRPGIDHPFATKEEASADIARPILISLGMPAPLVELATDVILSTNANVPCKTDTARCFRQADLNGLVCEPIVFLNGTYRLYKEMKLLKGEQPFSINRRPSALINDFMQFAGVSYEILNTYLAEDISLGDFDRDAEGRSLFALRAAANVNLLVPAKLRTFLATHLTEVVGYQPIGV